MKKIVFLLIIVLLFSGCSNKKYHKDVVKTPYEEKKDYYVSVVPIVNHDDYNYDIIKDSYKPETSEKTMVKIEQKEDIMENEAILSYDTLLANNNVNEEEQDLTSGDNETENNDIIPNPNEIKEEDKNNVTKDEVAKDDLVVIEEKDNLKEVNDKQYYSPSGKLLGTQKVKVIDVSYYQGVIDWDKFVSDSDCYGVILRLGYYQSLDKMFERNINEIKRLNIPYGIYLFSYATTLSGALKEANFTINMIDKYDLKPTLGIYYDVESWSTKNSSSSRITKEAYDEIVKLYVSNVSNHVNDNYKVKVYSNRWYAMNRLGDVAKSYVDWVAEYNSTCKYDGVYSMWQYTSKGRVPGINGNVDISYLY